MCPLSHNLQWPHLGKAPGRVSGWGPRVSQHIERETGCALEGRAVWPGLLEPPYLMGPSYSTLGASDLWPGHSSLGVDMGLGQVEGEQK